MLAGTLRQLIGQRRDIPVIHAWRS